MKSRVVEFELVSGKKGHVNGHAKVDDDGHMVFGVVDDVVFFKVKVDDALFDHVGDASQKELMEFEEFEDEVAAVYAVVNICFEGVSTDEPYAVEYKFLFPGGVFFDYVAAVEHGILVEFG